MVEKLYQEAGQGMRYKRVTETYSNGWRQESAVADTIVVNSQWPRDAIMAEGVPGERLLILPVAYEALQRDQGIRTAIPQKFSARRLQRAVFLGQIILRRGVGALFDAFFGPADAPVICAFLGSIQAEVPERIRNDPRVRFHGAVSRNSVCGHNTHTHLLRFPILSDGFGLPQLEALAFGVPILASIHCGDVGRHGVNGIILSEVTGETIAHVTWSIVASPKILLAMTEAASLDKQFTIAALGQNLTSIGKAMCAP